MGLSIQLVDTTLTADMKRQAKAHGKRKKGEPVSDIVDYRLEDGELEAVLTAVGRDVLPTLARIDPYDDTEFDHYFCELALAETDRIVGQSLPAPERTFLSELRRMFQQALAQPAYIVRFIGD
ncbi:hypothetical protein ACFWA9_04415 [Kitasatospora sp. NPDC059973]|uniref:hypothetical protein n=1 Tax=Kitasatospora sp. NPDC059973 TaxID=3347020 RepID=UPI0036789607